MNKFSFNRSRIVLLTAVLFIGLFSCRGPRELSSERFRTLSAEKLLEQAELNSFDYDDLTIKRINVQYSGSDSKINFRANLQAVKDDKILASISKLNFPVAKVMLTPDNVTYVNYLEKSFFSGDYSFITRLLNFQLTFETIQSIISYQVVPDSRQSRYISYVESGKYVLQTEGARSESKTASVKNLFGGRKLFASNPGDTDSVIKTLYFNPRTISLERLVYEDPVNEWKLDVNFSDFEKINKKDYPSTIVLKLHSPEETIDMKIKMNGFSLEEINSAGLAIPDNYQQIRLR